MRMRSQPPQPPQPILDEITEAALDSFPASDPPGWNGLKIGPPSAHHQQHVESPDETDTELRDRSEDAPS
jgi:hypothetical protein